MKFLETLQSTLLAASRFGCLLFFCTATTMGASAQTYRVVVSLGGAAGALVNSVTQGFDGDLYGTTVNGGTDYVGNVFKIARTGFTSLYSFCNSPSCTEGFGPTGLIQDGNGIFYGTNREAGLGWGAIYSITSDGAVTTLHDFNSTDGSLPEGLVLGDDGSFYGTTFFGGTHDLGTVFKITPTGSFTSLYSFCSHANCADGAYPGGLVLARDGSLYGTTTAAGSIDIETIFKLTPSGSLITLSTPSNGVPYALFQATDGNFYGVTGPSSSCNSGPGCGSVVRMNAAGEMTSIYDFCSQPNCADGYYPVALLEGSDQNFYGMTQSGSASGLGTIFKLTPAGTLTTLHSFAGFPTDGQEPTSFFQSTDGTFYGTTFYGGAHGNGIVFQLSTGLPPFVKIVEPFGRVGQTRAIVGQGFTGATAVSFNGTPASFVVVSDTSIETTVPVGATTGYVNVVTTNGSVKSNVVFTVRQ